MKRMFPNSEDYKAVLSQHTKFTNKEGIFGDSDIMSLTQDDSEHAIPTYQFWSEHGMLMPYATLSSCNITTGVLLCYITIALHCHCTTQPLHRMMTWQAIVTLAATGVIMVVPVLQVTRHHC